jgi:general secretion pathway protein I
LSRATEANPAIAGFTLIEALVALALVAVALSSIGALIATTVRGTRSIETRLVRLQAARTVIAALPDREQLVPGHFTGATENHSWRIDVAPFAAKGMQSQAPWIPLAVVTTVESPSGGAIEISTVRLRRSERR